MFRVPGTETESSAAVFPAAQVAAVRARIRQAAPDCRSQAAEVAAQLFLEYLRRQDSAGLEQLATGFFPWGRHESTLLRLLAAQLTLEQEAGLRERLALRRIQAVLAAEGGGIAGPDATVLLARIRDESRLYAQRLIEGRFDDEELIPFLRRFRQAGEPSAPAAEAKPKLKTAADIAAEFVRRNEDGAALQRLRACTVEGRLRPSTGGEQRLVLCRMQPDSFRLTVMEEGRTRYILAGEGGRFWQLVPGRAPQVVPAAAIGERRHLGEFVDPLYVAAGYDLERLEDGRSGDRPCYRIAVRRPDGSRYVCQIDTESFREVGRENDDGTSVVYSDFREIGGLTFAFREEVTDAAGRRGVLELTRLTPNPGLVSALFQLPVLQQSSLGLEELLAGAPAAPLSP